MMELSSLDGLMGIWSLPDLPESKINGILSYIDGSIILKTTEQFNGIEDLEIIKYPVIIGFTSNGKKVTFIKCSKPSQKINMPGLIEFVFKPLVIIVGEQYKKEEDIFFSSVNAHYFGLEKWIDDRPFQIIRIPETNEIITNYKMSPCYRCNLDGFVVSTDNECNYHVELSGSFELKQKTTITIEFNEVRYWQSAVDELYNYGAFLTLCMGTYCEIDSINAENNAGVQIEILHNYTPNKRQKLKAEFLVDFKDIRDNYEQHLRRWYEIKNEMTPIIAYFIEVHNISGAINVVTGFLKMAQALESYSRKTRNETIRLPEVHAQRINNIIADIEDEDNRAWLEVVLKTPILNEPSLTSRITALLTETSSILGISKSKLKSLAYKIVVSRNYYTHFNKDIKEKILSDHDLYYSTTLLKYVLRIHLFRELKIADGYIKEKLLSDTELNYALVNLRLAPELKIFSIKTEKQSSEQEMKSE
ncbi:HEPN domain-containing protein [Bacteroides sp.]|uniref:ApeA N-terminal domain 1-containing protein n=1 Tax=Bacteroides sp. TaxID=29523 RepID=UPI00261EC566|nr:HEPN domain-containing protein [Bacteroides sp.]MDD3041133.1 hypothetical protein [Bacteroides sp.]